MDAFILRCFEQGYNIEKYGLLGKTGGIQEKRVEKEVISEKWVEIPVEVIKEVEKIVEVIKEIPVEKVVEVIKEVPIDKIVEVIKEVPVEKIVEKEVYITDDSQTNELLLKIQQLENERQEFSTKIEEMIEEQRIFSTKTQEMENIFQNRIKELESREPEKIEIIKEVVNDDKQKLLQQTLQTLRGQLNLKDEEIKKLREDIEYLKGEIDKPATYLRNSNLKDNLYK